MKLALLLLFPILAFAAEDPVVKLWWDCDFASNQNLMDSSDAGICSENFEVLKKEKFGGDFSKFIAWWNEHKAAEYAKRAK